MNERLHGWLVVGVSATFFLLDGLIVMGFEASRTIWFWVSSLSLVAVVAGLHFLWRTGIFQRSPLSRVSSFAIGVLIFGQLMQIMHWPYGVLLIVTAFVMNLIAYIVHFFMKRRWATRDILRLVAMVLTCTLFPMSILHWIPAVQVYWAVIGMIALASLEHLLNPKRIPAATSRPAGQSRAADKAKGTPGDDSLKSQYPELFDEGE